MKLYQTRKLRILCCLNLFLGIFLLASCGEEVTPASSPTSAFNSSLPAKTATLAGANLTTPSRGITSTSTFSATAGSAGVVSTLSSTSSISPAVSAPSIEAKIDDYMKAILLKEHVPGASIAILQQGRLILAKGYGLANVELSVGATIDTVYELLSIGKQFTATAILMLYEAGRLGLDDKLSKYLADLPSNWTEITVRQLLTHTSGVPDYTEAPGFSQNLQLGRSPQELLKPVQALPLVFSPGTQWRYSNSNYYLLGLLIEKLSGQSYADYLQEHIFQPLQMKVSRVNALQVLMPQRAAGYHWQKDHLENALVVDPSQMWAAGAVVSSVTDLTKWDAALYTEKLLKKATLEQSWTPGRLNNGAAVDYGFGNELSVVQGHRIAGHQGGGLAFNATFLRYVDDQLSIIVLCNLTQAPTKVMAQHLASFYIPGLSTETNQGIEDKDPQTTVRLKQVVSDAQQGKADPGQFAAQSQALVGRIKQAGPQLLGQLGVFTSFVLLERTEAEGKVVYRYRAVFGTTSVIWTFELDKEGKIANLVPEPE